MIKAGEVALIVMFCLMAGGLMLASGAPPLGTALILSGFIMIFVGAGRLRSKARRGNPDTFEFILADLGSLTRRDWALFLRFLIAGICLLAAGFPGVTGGA